MTNAKNDAICTALILIKILQHLSPKFYVYRFLADCRRLTLHICTNDCTTYSCTNTGYLYIVQRVFLLDIFMSYFSCTCNIPNVSLKNIVQWKEKEEFHCTGEILCIAINTLTLIFTKFEFDQFLHFAYVWCLLGFS